MTRCIGIYRVFSGAMLGHGFEEEADDNIGAPAPSVNAQAAPAPPVRASLGIFHAVAQVSFELPRQILVDERRSASNQPATVQGPAQAVATMQHAGPSHTSAPLRTLAEGKASFVFSL